MKALQDATQVAHILNPELRGALAIVNDINVSEFCEALLADHEQTMQDALRLSVEHNSQQAETMFRDIQETLLLLNRSLKSVAMPSLPMWTWSSPSGKWRDDYYHQHTRSSRPSRDHSKVRRKPPTYLDSNQGGELVHVTSHRGIVGRSIRDSEYPVCIVLTSALHLRSIVVSCLHRNLAAASPRGRGPVGRCPRYCWTSEERVGSCGRVAN